MEQLLCTTKVMNIHLDSIPVLQVLCSALQMMANSRTNNSPVLPRCLLKFHKDTTSVTYNPLSYKEVQQKVDSNKFPQSNVRTLVALKDLGRGGNGKAWLCVTDTQLFSAVCVLKFDNNGCIWNLENERDKWHLLYPDFKHMVKVEMWSGANALVMPHLATVLFEEQVKYRDEVEKVLTAITMKMKVHKDVCWRNIGKYRRKDGDVAIVVFDLNDVVDYNEKSDQNWIEDTMKSLYSGHT